MLLNYNIAYILLSLFEFYIINIVLLLKMYMHSVVLSIRGTQREYENLNACG